MEKKRHGCLTTYLIFLALTSTTTLILMLLNLDSLKNNFPKFTENVVTLFIFSVLLELFFVYQLFKWKKIGFYGLWITLFFFDSYINQEAGVLNINTILGALIRLGLLFLVLKIKKNKTSGWDNLE